MEKPCTPPAHLLTRTQTLLLNTPAPPLSNQAGQVFYEALGIVGGTYGSLMAILFTVYLALFITARAWVRWQQPPAAKKGAIEGDGEAFDVSLGEKKGAAQLHAELVSLRAELSAQGRELAALRTAVAGGSLKLLEPRVAAGSVPPSQVSTQSMYQL